MTGYNLLLVGCGNMAGAMLAGWLDAGLVAQAVVVKPSPLALKHPALRAVSPEQGVPEEFRADLVVLGVKPQILNDVLPAYRHYAGHAPFLSLAAGKTLAYFERQLGPDAAVIRSMPNLPATVRMGATPCCASTAVTPAQRDMVTTLLQAIGTVHWIEEADMNAVTALSGGGPAHVFLLLEMLQQAAETLGLDPVLASTLARETIIGTAQLLAQSSEDAAVLRARVTSKAGTTEAAIRILLQNDALPTIYASALQAGAARAAELAD